MIYSLYNVQLQTVQMFLIMKYSLWWKWLQKSHRIDSFFIALTGFSFLSLSPWPLAWSEFVLLPEKRLTLCCVLAFFSYNCSCISNDNFTPTSFYGKFYVVFLSNSKAWTIKKMDMDYWINILRCITCHVQRVENCSLTCESYSKLPYIEWFYWFYI